MPEPTERDRTLLGMAIRLAEQCPPSDTAFSVGAVLADADGTVLASGYSREHEPREHAEEAALYELGWRVPHAENVTIYSSLEPCSARSSRSRSCVDHILEAGIGRVVFAWREPSVFVVGEGAERLIAAGREVLEIDDLAQAAMARNTHIPGISHMPYSE